MGLRLILPTVICLCCGCAIQKMPCVHVSIARGFELASTGKPFTPWGFNYDRDYRMRLIEEYWHDEWPTVEQDFREMNDLGANVVRVHLQFHRFVSAPGKTNQKEVAKLTQLLNLAENLGLH